MGKTWVDELFVSGLYRKLWTKGGELDIGSERTSQEVDSILSILQPSAGAHILDWCGGYGRHAIELARRGFRVTLLDYTPLHLDEAREYAKRHEIRLSLVQADFRSTPKEIQADYAINLFSSGIGYFGEEEDVKALRSLYESLKSEARIIIETMNLNWLFRNFQPRSWRVSDDNTLYLLEERGLNFATGKLECQNIVLGLDGKRHEFHTTHFVYSAEDLCRILAFSGFKALKIFGGLDRREQVGFRSPRLVIVAEKS